MAYTIAFQGTRVNSSDTNTNWSKLGVGGGAPAAEAANVYQGAAVVGNQVKTTIGGVEYDPGAGAIDMTLAANALWFAKAICTDNADMVTTIGGRLSIGSANNAFYHYIIAGTNANRSRFDTWPPGQSLLVVAVNISVAAWQEGTGTGTPTDTAIDYFAFEVDMNTGFSKSENMGLDAIDIGTGIMLYGTAPTVDGYQAFVTWDEGTVGNRYGVTQQALGSGAPILCNGRLDIGDGTNATDFDSVGETVVYPDGYHASGDVGVLVNLNAASSTFTDASTHIGLGTASVEDTRPDYTITGSASPGDVTGTLTNFNNVRFDSTVTASNATIQATNLELSGSSIFNSTIICDSLSGTATIIDPTFGANSGIRNTEFVQDNNGHALEIDTAGNYTFTGLTFTGFGADGSPSSSLYISAATGQVTISVADGDSPTYLSDGADVLITNPIFFTLTGIESGSEVRILSNSLELSGQEEIDTGEDFVYAYNYPGYTQIVDVVVHALDYEYLLIRGVELTNANSSIPIQQTFDRNYLNPS
jgi:hypothetical protein